MKITKIMAGHNQNLQGEDDNIKNGTDPDNQTEDENAVEEYGTLDSKLDELNTALDYLEQKNDNIHAQLKQLLQSNIDIRQQMQNENIMETEPKK